VVEGVRYLQGKRKYQFRLSCSPGHYYSPIPSASDLERVYGAKQRLGAVPEILLREQAQLDLVGDLGSYAADFVGEGNEDQSRYDFRNEMFNGGDAVVLYAMMRHFRPTRIVEVGSGHSSALMLDVNDRWFSKEIAMTFIEPYPDRLLSILRPADYANATLLTTQVQDVDLALFRQLGRDDFLFIDSSHVSKAGSDVNFLIFDVLPILQPGVIVHIHDIFWPFEYPKEWAHEGRAWNENYVLRAFLAYNTRFEIVLFNNWLAKTQADVSKLRMSGWSPDGTGSLWLRCVG
jgi:Methyltransferase domain